MNNRDRMKQTLKIMDMITGDSKKVKENLTSKPKSAKRPILKEDDIKVEQSKKTYDNSANDLEEVKLTKESVERYVMGVLEEQGTIKGMETAKLYRESLRKIVNNDKLWRGAGEKFEWHTLESQLRNEFKNMDK